MQDKAKQPLRKPEWLKIKLHNDPHYAQVSELVREHSLHTICQSGRCPNISECWSRGTATFMIGGDVCTRSCRFCATKSGRPAALDVSEPDKLARSIEIMGLRHAVITSVDRDDLQDGGAAHWVRTIRAVRAKTPSTVIELLIPDFDASAELLDMILEAGADIVGHNMETVREISPLVRSRARYDTSLQVLKYLSDKGADTKSGLMVGLGETQQQVVATLKDLSEAGVRRVTLGQYLRPSSAHYPVAEYVHPDVFDYYRDQAQKLGFTHIESGPLVRSSYMADRQNQKRKVSLCGKDK